MPGMWNCSIRRSSAACSSASFAGARLDSAACSWRARASRACSVEPASRTATERSMAPSMRERGSARTALRAPCAGLTDGRASERADPQRAVALRSRVGSGRSAPRSRMIRTVPDVVIDQALEQLVLVPLVLAQRGDEVPEGAGQLREPRAVQPLDPVHGLQDAAEALEEGAVLAEHRPGVPAERQGVLVVDLEQAAPLLQGEVAAHLRVEGPEELPQTVEGGRARLADPREVGLDLHDQGAIGEVLGRDARREADVDALHGPCKSNAGRAGRSWPEVRNGEGTRR